MYGFGQRDGVPYLAMKYLSGGTLADRLKAGALEPPAAAELMAKVASGVAAAHALGIVHRDLKPGNVLLDEAGEPKVTDFGLARGAAVPLGAAQADRRGALRGNLCSCDPGRRGWRSRLPVARDRESLGARRGHDQGLRTA